MLQLLDLLQVDTRNVTAGSTASCSHSVKCRTGVLAPVFSNGTLLVWHAEVWLVGGGAHFGCFFFFLNIHFWNSSFPEPFCKLGTVFSGFPSLRVVSLHLVESLSVLLVPGSFWLHLRPNPIISEIKEKNCIYFQGNSMFCFVFLFPLFLFLVIHNM